MSNPSFRIPDLILLKIGINDLNHNWEMATAPERLDLLLERLFSLNPEVRILIASLLKADQNNPCRGGTTNNISEAVREYNAALETLVTAHRALGWTIIIVDMHTRRSLADLSDDLHPNEDGYEKGPMPLSVRRTLRPTRSRLPRERSR